MRYLSFLMLIILFFVSCKHTKNYIDVQNISNLSKFYSNNFIYTLPKTKIIIEIEARKIICSKGPYVDYTKQFLGELSNTVKANKMYWEISNVEFSTVAIPDTQNIYVIGTSSNNYAPLLTLTKEGFPIAYNISGIDFISNNIEKNSKFEINKKEHQEISFGTMNNKTYKVIYDTVYEAQMYDTVIKQVPILKPNLVKKTKYEQAKELADKITILRDDKAALLVGEADNDNLPTGEALRIMLKEIVKLENEYLSMFTGKTDTVTYRFTFDYVPVKNYKNTKILLLKYTQTNGVLNANALTGTPIFLEINSDDISQDINKFETDISLYKRLNSKKTTNGLFYRVPQKSKIKLLFDKQLLSEKTIFIAQFGEIMSFPAEILQNTNVKIKFYPNLGAISSINY